MKIKSKQTIIIQISNKKAERFCQAVNKIIAAEEKIGYKESVLNEREMDILKDISDRIYCDEE